jgi:hypothetical protein
MKVKRVVLLVSVILVVMVTCSFAQNHARPRSGDQRGHQAEGAPPQQHQNQGQQHRGDGQQARRGDGGHSQAGRGSAQQHQDQGQQHRGDGQQARRGDYGRSQAEQRHPNMQQPYRQRDYQFEQHGWYRFPRHYDGPSRYYHRYYRHQLIRPHFRGWSSESGLYWYWPFYDQPIAGCGWYWVPTVQVPEFDDDGNIVSYRYLRWRYVYLCIEGDQLGW